MPVSGGVARVKQACEGMLFGIQAVVQVAVEVVDVPRMEKLNPIVDSGSVALDDILECEGSLRPLRASSRPGGIKILEAGTAVDNEP